MTSRMTSATAGHGLALASAAASAISFSTSAAMAAICASVANPRATISASKRAIGSRAFHSSISSRER